MKAKFGLFICCACFFAAACGAAEQSIEAEQQTVVEYEPMAPFAALAGKAWRGEGVGPNGQPIVDIARYEMILGGKAFQSTHRLEDGSYGGRTIIFYDEGAEKHIFHYFTTAGFHTTGEITPTETGFVSVEKVQGHPEFVEVRAEAFFEEDLIGPVIRIRSSHVKMDGETSEGEELIYREIDDPGPLY